MQNPISLVLEIGWEAHNFPKGEKVRHFYVTLIGEARLWYELLTLLDDDWPTFQI